MVPRLSKIPAFPVPRLVIQKKWFQNERDLTVGDVVFYRKTESELGDGGHDRAGDALQEWVD